MRERKSLYLVIFALAVVTVSFVLISVWGYHFYFAPKKIQPIASTFPKDSSIDRKTSINDTLQTILDKVVEEFNVGDDSIYDTSTDKTLALKLIEFNRLKNEIAGILKKKLSSKEISEANEKISQLQQSINQLKNENDELGTENERLNKLIKRQNEKSNVAEQNTIASRSPKKHLAKSAYTFPVLVTHLRFTGITLNDNKHTQTHIAAKTKKVTGSFQINVKPFNHTPDIYVIVIQPNGKTLYNSAIESGMFETKDGRKVYSALLHFDNKENGRRLSFSIDANHFQKGKYIMQVYHRGIMIGRLSKTLF